MDPLAPRVLARFLEAYGTGRGWEHRREKEEAVIVNMPPHLQALWRKTKNQFKGTPEQRLEKFLEYVHEHEGEAMSVLQDEADKAVQKMVREYQHREEPEPVYHHGPHYVLPEPVDDIPFS